MFNAVKIGMLGNEEIISAVASALEVHKPAHIVVDPVMVSSSGKQLLSHAAIAVMKTRIFPLATVLTPNLDEAAVLLNEPVISCDSLLEGCAESIAQLGVAAVLLKGGHFEQENARDVLFDGQSHRSFEARRIMTKNTHGTGCTLSAAISGLSGAWGDTSKCCAAGTRIFTPSHRNCRLINDPNGGRGH